MSKTMLGVFMVRTVKTYVKSSDMLIIEHMTACIAFTKVETSKSRVNITVNSDSSTFRAGVLDIVLFREQPQIRTVGAVSLHLCFILGLRGKKKKGDELCVKHWAGIMVHPPLTAALLSVR